MTFSSQLIIISICVMNVWAKHTTVQVLRSENSLQEALLPFYNFLGPRAQIFVARFVQPNDEKQDLQNDEVDLR